MLGAHWITEYTQTHRNYSLYHSQLWPEEAALHCSSSDYPINTFRSRDAKPRSLLPNLHALILDMLLIPLLPWDFLVGYLSVWCPTSIEMLMDDLQGNVKEWWRQFPNSRWEIGDFNPHLPVLSPAPLTVSQPSLASHSIKRRNLLSFSDACGGCNIPVLHFTQLKAANTSLVPRKTTGLTFRN